MPGCPLSQGSPRAHRGGGPGQKWARGGVCAAPGALHPAELTQSWQILQSKIYDVFRSIYIGNILKLVTALVNCEADLNKK